jgi:hypothetical protein
LDGLACAPNPMLSFIYYGKLAFNLHAFTQCHVFFLGMDLLHKFVNTENNYSSLKFSESVLVIAVSNIQSNYSVSVHLKSDMLKCLIGEEKKFTNDGK